jgi:hypothetical protein
MNDIEVADVVLTLGADILNEIHVINVNFDSKVTNKPI